MVLYLVLLLINLYYLLFFGSLCKDIGQIALQGNKNINITKTIEN